MSRVEAVALKTMALAVQGDTKAAADFIRIATLMGEFASGGPKHTEAGHLIVPKRAETPEEKELFLLELAEFRRKYVAGELYPKSEDLRNSHQSSGASSSAADGTGTLTLPSGRKPAS